MESILGQLIIALTLLTQTLTSNPVYAETLDKVSTTTPIVIATTTPLTKRQKVLNAISKCESHNTQFNPDGSVYRGIINHQDVGYFQINEKYHLAASQKLGVNIYTLEGNIEYANLLYDKEGTTPWNASKGCWLPLVVDG